MTKYKVGDLLTDNVNTILVLEIETEGEWFDAVNGACYKVLLSGLKTEVNHIARFNSKDFDRNMWVVKLMESENKNVK